MKKTIIAGVIMALLSTSALSHTNSIGYVGDGTGGINFWYGNWHGQPFNEAEIKIIRPDGTTSISAFNLLSQNSPAGLLPGVNFFTSNQTILVPYDPTGLTNGNVPQESYAWQGINYQNLATGTYTFVYIPLGDPESSNPTGTPTQDWAPMDNVIRSLTVTITQGDLNGDANQNGILDILEVLSGQASGSGPTVVSQGSSTVLGYIAVAGGVLQVISRTQTDTTWDNMSDGTTTNTQTNTTNLTPFSGRTDQIANAQQMQSISTRGLSFDGVTIINHNAANGKTTGAVFGGHRVLDNGLSIGGGIAKLSTDAASTDGGASADGIVLNLHVDKKVERGTVSVGLTRSMTDLTTTRTIGDFANAGTTAGTDTSVGMRFVANGEQVRPVVGYTRGVRSVDGYTETGSAQSARTVAESTDYYGYATIGAQATLAPGVEAQALRHTDGVSVLSLNVNKEWEKDKTLLLGVSRSFSDLDNVTSISAGIQIKF
jgi:hypothetical protein